MKENENTSICEQLGIISQPPSPDSKLGIALETIGELPMNGLRVEEENGTNGWYIWCGAEMKSDEDFFSPLHLKHIAEHLPQVEKYLDLPVGYRFLIDGKGHQDVWFDLKLLNGKQ